MLVEKFVPILNFLADVKTHIEKLLTGKTCERERERSFARMEYSSCMQNGKWLWNKIAPI